MFLIMIILQSRQYYYMFDVINKNSVKWKQKLIPMFNWMSDELTLNASDNDIAPDEPMLL